MLSRSFLRSFKRAALPNARTLPKAIPSASNPRPHFFSQISQLLRAPPPRIRIRRRPNYPYSQADFNNAEPLVTPEALRAFARSPQFKYILVIAASGGVIFYCSNLETVPVSGRRRFNCYSDESVEAEGARTYDAMLKEMKGGILPTWDLRYKQVSRVMKRLIPASGLQDVDWEVHVVSSPSANAFVIPGGKVFVFTGILPIAANDDGLAAILGHEIAHNLARHAAEAMSSMVLFAPIRLLLMALDSSGVTMGFGHILANIGMDLGIMRPASRKQESEADYIGLMMMAQSCYNPEEAVRVWERMENFQAQEEQTPEWLSTHPSNSNRIGQMKGWLDKAQEARSQSDCASTIGHADSFGSAVQSLMFR